MIEVKSQEEVFIDILGTDWFTKLYPYVDFVSLRKTGNRIAFKRKTKIVYPEKDEVFKVFQMPIEEIKVVIVGMSPYYNGTANGYSFSSKDMTPSLQKIFEALEEMEEEMDVPFQLRESSLQRWIDQGVFLLNRIMTTEERRSDAHSNIGWQDFTNGVIKCLSETQENLVFMLWGRDAREVSSLIDYKKHLILEAEHPAAACYADRKWIHNDPFIKCNEYLNDNNKKIIYW